jgi:hypothetical protein
VYCRSAGIPFTRRLRRPAVGSAPPVQMCVNLAARGLRSAPSAIWKHPFHFLERCAGNFLFEALRPGQERADFLAALRVKALSERSAPLGAGLVMFGYAACHFISHATGLFRLRGIQAIGHDIVLAPWRTPIGLTILLSGSSSICSEATARP